jgi:hypothetical protein
MGNLPYDPETDYDEDEVSYREIDTTLRKADDWLSIGVEAARLLSERSDKIAAVQAAQTANIADKIARKAKDIASLVRGSVIA